MFSRTFFVLSFVAFNAFAQTPRTVFVQLFEWPWLDVARECELYLGPAGFSAVQVSPPNEHLSLPTHPWWERYQPISYKIVSRGGDEADFREMVRRCSQAGVDVYADAVINHMSAYKNGVGFAGTNFSEYNYPGLYSRRDFHNCGRNGHNGIVDFEDIYELQNCELLGLDDLDTSSYYVQTTLADYLNNLLKMGVKGLRIDAAKHVSAVDIYGILSRLDQPAYIFQELILGPTDPLSRKDYLRNGDITMFSYPYQLGNAFKNRNLAQLPNMVKEDIDSQDAIVFIENHDLQRWPNRDGLISYLEDPQVYRLAQAFMLTWPYGYPHLFSGYKFKKYDDGPPLNSRGFTENVLDRYGACREPWSCEHRLPEVASLVRFRNETNSVFYVSKWWSNGSDQIAFARGPLGFVVINGSKGNLKQSLKTDFSAGEYCNLLDQKFLKEGACSKGYVVDGNHVMTIDLPPNSAAIFLWSEKL